MGDPSSFSGVNGASSSVKWDEVENNNIVNILGGDVATPPARLPVRQNFVIITIRRWTTENRDPFGRCDRSIPLRDAFEHFHTAIPFAIIRKLFKFQQKENAPRQVSQTYKLTV